MIEINSFANPIPYAKHPVSNFIREYLIKAGYTELVSDFDLDTFEINVLDKRTTLTEKLVSLMRFSLSDNTLVDLSAKIRHFYDLYYLSRDKECAEFIENNQFMTAFIQLIEHDKKLFEQPIGWRDKTLRDSILLKDPHSVWKKLQSTYLQ